MTCQSPRSGWLAALAVSIAAFMLVGCDGSDEKPATAPPQTTTQAPTPEPPAPTTPEPASAPERGTTLATIDGSNPVDIIGGPHGFSAVVTLTDAAASSVTTYDTAGNELTTIGDGALNGSCGAADVVVPGRGRLIIAKLDHETPAQGIKPAESSVDLKAFDADTGEEVWSTKAPRAGGSCSDGDFGATSDGRFGLWAPDAEQPLVVNLQTGKGRVDTRAIVTVGPYVADLRSPNVDRPSADTYTITDPSSGQPVGKLDNIHLDGEPVAVPHWLVPDHGGGPPPAGLSSDGKILIAEDQDPPLNPGGNDGRLLAVSLPSGKQVWKTAQTFMPYILGNGDGAEVINIRDAVRAVDDHTGRERWHVPEGEVCAVTDSEMLLAINDQLAVIDMKTGKQLDYDDSESECPGDVVDGGRAVSSDSGQLTVIQLLNP